MFEKFGGVGHLRMRGTYSARMGVSPDALGVGHLRMRGTYSLICFAFIIVKGVGHLRMRGTYSTTTNLMRKQQVTASCDVPNE